MFLQLVLKKDVLGLTEAVEAYMDSLAKNLVEAVREWDYDDIINEARFQIVNRVRGGKIQRRRKVSAVKGYRFQDGRLVRMSPREQMNRKRSQRKGAIRRRSKIATSLRRRKVSIRKRGAL